MKHPKVESDRGRPVVTVELDRPRTLRFDFEGCRKFQRATGVDILRDPNAFFLRHLGVGTLPEFVWAFGSHEDEDLEAEALVSVLTLKQLGTLSVVVVALVLEGLVEAETITREEAERRKAMLFKGGDAEAQEGSDPLAPGPAS